MRPEQDGCGEAGLLVGLLNLLESRGLGERAPDPEADRHDDDAEQERDPPTPGEQVLLRQCPDGDEHQRRQDQAHLSAAESEAGEEATAVGWRVLQGHGVGTGLLSGRREPLQKAENDQQDRRKDTDLGVGRQDADENRGQTHQEQGEDEHRPAAETVPEVPQDDGADRPGDVGDPEGRKRGKPCRLRVGRGKEELRKDECRSRPVQEEVVVLDGTSDPAGESGLLWCLDAVGLVRPLGVGGEIFHLLLLVWTAASVAGRSKSRRGTGVMQLERGLRRSGYRAKTRWWTGAERLVIGLALVQRRRQRWSDTVADQSDQNGLPHGVHAVLLDADWPRSYQMFARCTTVRIANITSELPRPVHHTSDGLRTSTKLSVG